MLSGTAEALQATGSLSNHLSLFANGRGSCRQRSAKCYQNKALQSKNTPGETLPRHLMVPSSLHSESLKKIKFHFPPQQHLKCHPPPAPRNTTGVSLHRPAPAPRASSLELLCQDTSCMTECWQICRPGGRKKKKRCLTSIIFNTPWVHCWSSLWFSHQEKSMTLRKWGWDGA